MLGNHLLPPRGGGVVCLPHRPAVGGGSNLPLNGPAAASSPSLVLCPLSASSSGGTSKPQRVRPAHDAETEHRDSLPSPLGFRPSSSQSTTNTPHLVQREAVEDLSAPTSPGICNILPFLNRGPSSSAPIIISGALVNPNNGPLYPLPPSYSPAPFFADGPSAPGPP